MRLAHCQSIVAHDSSVRLVVDSPTGNVAERIDYDEFGNVISDSTLGFQPFGFAGGIRDIDTALNRFGARDYAASTARWVAKDPLGLEAAFNLYEYASGDPLNYIDPEGAAVIWHPHRRRGPRRRKGPAGLTKFTTGRAVPRPDSCRQNPDGTFEYDADAYLGIETSYRRGVDPNVPSVDEPGFTLGQHEAHHDQDVTGGLPQVSDPTKGFPSVEECYAATNNCNWAVHDYIHRLINESRKNRDKPPK
jgi:RHS repeat-associated protein